MLYYKGYRRKDSTMHMNQFPQKAFYRLNNLGKTAAIIISATILTLFLWSFGIREDVLLMVYMISVIICAAATHDYRYCTLTALFGVFSYNYFYTEPFMSFHIQEKNDSFILLFFLITAVISSTITAQFVQASQKSRENELKARQLYRQRERARSEAQLAQVKSRLLRSIGHDLRTPLTGILCGSNYIADHCATMKTAEIQKMAADISDQVEWLIGTMENILYMTRIDAQNLEPDYQPEVVDDVMEEAVRRVPGLKDRPFSLHLPAQIETVPMDGKMIVQVLMNLLDNAVFHTLPGTAISLSAARVEDNIRFTVEDAGEGIPPDKRETIFEEFVTSKKGSIDGRRGTGLGLAICKAVILAHHGLLTVGDSPMGGASFSFILPTEEQKNESDV